MRTDEKQRSMITSAFITYYFSIILILFKNIFFATLKYYSLRPVKMIA